MLGKTVLGPMPTQRLPRILQAMKVIIAGTRTLKPTIYQIGRAVDACYLKLAMTEVVCGMAPGVDLAGRDWAKAVGMPHSEWPAKWKDT